MASIPVPRQLQASNDFTWQVVDLCERFSSMVMLIGLSPLLAVSAATVSMLSGQSPFIAHKRVGRYGATLWMLKLRTMWGGASGVPRRASRWVEYIEDEEGPTRKQAADPRVPNSFARFCRRHSIDELPQLWHVVTGQMALVGPRPVTPAELRQYYGSGASAILDLKPGIAGLWQVSGRNRLTYAQRRDFDLEFVRSRSVALYLRILWRTLPEVLSGANSW
ncbi:MAG TPA: sugar transferase [Candidatus Sulfopaludibacter sp.]|jgi:exopolysaccharide production protein ExoY|nr:sugar transferase [Candidatus Sulfopaludibacter sp.]